MWAWLAELYDIKRTDRELSSVCQSCEILKVELSNMRREKEILLQHVLNPPAATAPEPVSEPELIRPKHIPWRVKQQELETADRQQAARIMQEFKAKVNPVNIEKLEKEMGIADG